jgi:hypothetical protein
MKLAKRGLNVAGAYTVPQFLTKLGIQYRGGSRNFWENNKANLNHLREAMIDEVKDRFIDLHPDRNLGNEAECEEACKELSRGLRKALRTFYMRLGDRPKQVVADVISFAKVGPRGPGRRGKVVRHKDAFAAASLIQEGKPLLAILREMPQSYVRLKKIRAHIPPNLIKPCACGKPAAHNGRCKGIVLPPEQLAKLRAGYANRTNFAHSEEAKKKISQSCKGRRITPDVKRILRKRTKERLARNLASGLWVRLPNGQIAKNDMQPLEEGKP